MYKAFLRQLASVVAVSLLALGVGSEPGAQSRDTAASFPSRPVRIFVQGGPGSPPDYRVRMLANCRRNALYILRSLRPPIDG